MPSRIFDGNKKVVLRGGCRPTRIHALVRQTFARKDTWICEIADLMFMAQSLAICKTLKEKSGFHEEDIFLKNYHFILSNCKYVLTIFSVYCSQYVEKQP